MSTPRREVDDIDEDRLTLVPVPAIAASPLSLEPSYLRDDYDPEAAIMMLRQFREERSEDPEADWAEFLEYARAIDEDCPPGMCHFDQYLNE